MVKGVKLLLHLICAHDPRGQSVFGVLLLSSERRMFLCSVFRCSARRRLKVLRSSRQQNQHFIPFKSEDRKLKINLPLPRGGSLSFASGSFRCGMFLFVSVAPRRLFHPPLAFTFPFPRSWRLFNNKTPPRRVPTQTAEPLKTQRLPRPPSNKPIQSAAQEEDRAAALRDLMSRQFDFNGDDD